MNKNVELATALSFVKDQLKVSVTDAVAETTKNAGIETTADNWSRIKFAIEQSIETAVNDSHTAFRSLVR